LNGGSVEIFSNQIKWIVENKDSLNIVFVAQVGDLVQSVNEKEEEWINADKVMSLLEDSVSTNIKDGIPYGIAVGNHDNGWIPGDTKLYNKYFGESRFSGRSYYGGHYGDKNDNHYAFFSASGMNFMVVFIEISNNQKVNNNVLAWVNELLKTYHNRQVIIVSHFMIYKSGSWSGQGNDIFNTLKNNPNLFLMFCGHVKGEGMRKDFVNPNQVYTLLSNYQHYTNGGNGFLRIVEFSPKNDKINVRTYSPTLNQFEADSNSQFVLDYYMNDAPVIAAFSNDTIYEDSDGKEYKIIASDIDGDTLTYSAYSDTTGLNVTVSNDTVRLKPIVNYYGTSKITVIANDGAISDSSTFSFTVTNIQDAPSSFEWVSYFLDTVNINQTNLLEVYNLEWTESKDVDGDSINYLLYAKIGNYPKENVYDTTSTSLQISYRELLDNTFKQIPMLSRAKVKFSVRSTDGIDTIQATGNDRVVFVNRYDYLSTEIEDKPTEFALHENYPNPFNPMTTLRFDLPVQSNVNIIIYSILGQKVKTFNMQSSPPGYHSIEWNATNEYGDLLGAGIYLYRLQAKDFVKTRKMIYLK